jgi:hypothetical protein
MAGGNDRSLLPLMMYRTAVVGFPTGRGQFPDSWGGLFATSRPACGHGQPPVTVRSAASGPCCFHRRPGRPGSEFPLLRRGVKATSSPSGRSSTSSASSSAPSWGLFLSSPRSYTPSLGFTTSFAAWGLLFGGSQGVVPGNFLSQLLGFGRSAAARGAAFYYNDQPVGHRQVSPPGPL